MEITEDIVEKTLSELRCDSATGPDAIPTKIMKECAKQLARPLFILANRILDTGRWPDIWMVHWIVPLHKKNNVYTASNYRGVHLTAQASKVMERVVRKIFQPFLLNNTTFGSNQFAYSPERGARDALALLLMEWITAFSKGQKIGIYCSDVSGAFDRVELGRLVAKLQKKKLHPKLVAVIKSWLRNRRAKVVIGGESSEDFILSHMVYQGTVWGPTLWNLFYEDARRAINEVLYTEVVFADDLNAYRVFPNSTTKEQVIGSLSLCQSELHLWGKANQVAFDAGKESFHLMSRYETYGGNLKMLGVEMDMSLSMKVTVHEVVAAAGWNLRMLIRTKLFYTDAELIGLYKTQLLSYLEYRTPAIYHAKRDVLRPLDRVQQKLLDDAGVDAITALMEFNLAPLNARRDMAMLGLIHRTVLGKGPKHFRKYFKVIGSRTLEEVRVKNKQHLVRCSALGLIAFYNLLPLEVRELQQVSDFQGALQKAMKARAADGCGNWPETFSPRMSLPKHPLV